VTPVQQLPVALCVATGHEAGIVQRALRSRRVEQSLQSRFEVVVVGVSCSNINSTALASSYSTIVSTGFAGALKRGVETGSLLFPKVVKKVDDKVYAVESKEQLMIGGVCHIG